MKKKRSKLQWLACLLVAAVMMTAGAPTVSVRAEEFADEDWTDDELNQMGHVGTGGPGNDSGIIKTYQTYTKTNPITGQIYAGRTRGTGSAVDNVAARDAYHHMNSQGYGQAVLDKSSTSYDAIRGREQMLIDANGGAQSMGGTSGNAINGISAYNPNKLNYMNAAEKEFGKIE